MDLLLVNIPADLGKKPYDLVFPFLKRLNFGMLALATFLTNRGYDVALFDPQAVPPGEGLSELVQYIKQEKPAVIGLSCISGFSYPSCKATAVALREHFGPQFPLIIGGKDHVGQIGEAVLSECPAIDIVVRGEAETTMESLLEALRTHTSLDLIPNLVYRADDGRICTTPFCIATASPPLPALRYDLYPAFQTFPPSLEVGRGCIYNCDFCISAKTGLRKKSVPAIADEATSIAALYEDEEVRLYLETPLFLMHDEELRQFVQIRQAQGLRFTWRTETRVEYLTPQRIHLLAEAGLRVIDLGLESASPQILLSMGKTRNPTSYLQKAAQALQAAYEANILVKLNILFYLGETKETLRMTLAFLEEHLPYVTSVSAYPLLLYPGSSLEGGIADAIAHAGGSLVQTAEWQGRHLWPVNVSAEWTYDALQALGLQFTKAFQTQETFYRKKQYGYFSPQVTEAVFAAKVKEIGREYLPFAQDQAEAARVRQHLWHALS